MFGDVAPGLIREKRWEPEFKDEVRLPTHPDIRKSGRIYAFITPLLAGDHDAS
jgi:hypothetical protein